jgi:hypothetical protein
MVAKPSNGNVRTNRKVQSPATAILMMIMSVSLLVLAGIVYRKRRQSTMLFYSDGDVSTMSNGTYMENSTDYSDDGFVNWSNSSGSRLPTVLETVVLD